MFARAPNASKIAFATLLANAFDWGISLVDCQVYTEHLATQGEGMHHFCVKVPDLEAALARYEAEGLTTTWRCLRR